MQILVKWKYRKLLLYAEAKGQTHQFSIEQNKQEDNKIKTRTGGKLYNMCREGQKIENRATLK